MYQTNETAGGNFEFTANGSWVELEHLREETKRQKIHIEQLETERNLLEHKLKRWQNALLRVLEINE